SAREIHEYDKLCFNKLIEGKFKNINPFVKSNFKVEIKEFRRDADKFHGRFIHYWDEQDIDELPEIVEPSMHGMVEVMRGCGRGCKFCDVTLRPLRYYPPEKVKKEIEVNMKKGNADSAWLHSDDIFVYGLDPRKTKNMDPNREALEDLYTAVMSTGIGHTNPINVNVAGAIA